MNFTLLQDKYPVYSLEVMKTDTRFADVDAIIAYLRDCVVQDKIASLIGEFDHYAHTAALPAGLIAEQIRAAEHLVFCFGTQLPNSLVMAVRPRAIGVVDEGDRFVISFMEAPMPLANTAMTAWIEGIADKTAPINP